MLPEKNIAFESLPPHPDIKKGVAYIYTDADGVEAVVTMTGHKQAAQQKALDKWAEETIGRRAYQRGYRYRLTPIKNEFAPLYVKTADQVGKTKRRYPNHVFTACEIDEMGQRRIPSKKTAKLSP